MMLIFISKINSSIFLLEQLQIVTILSVVVVFFLVLLILGVRKSYLLKKENDKLNRMGNSLTEDENKEYKDFTDGHMYQ